VQYNGFLSYSHAADGSLAPTVQSALHRFARPWYRLRSVWIFRDKTGLAVTPSLWGTIEKALAVSEYFLLMASPEAAASPWVQKEVDWWLANRSASNILILLTEGEIGWNSSASDFDWTRSSALPPSLRRRMAQEPLWVDLRWVRTQEKLSLRNDDFRRAILDIAATLLNQPKESLDSEDVRIYKRNRWAAYAAVFISLLLAIGATTAAVIANRERILAKNEAKRADTEADRAKQNADQATRNAKEAVGQRNTAQERRREAERQRDIALARQLAAQAQSVISDQGSFPELSALLSIESLRRFRFLGNDHALRRALPFVNTPSGLVLSSDKVFVAKVTPGPNLTVGMSAIWLFDPPIRQRFLELDQQINNLSLEEASNAVMKFDARVAQVVALSPDGLYLATGNAEGTARVFDAHTGKGVSEIANQAAVTALAISPGGRHVITGCSDGTIRISEIRGGATAEFKYRSAVITAEFSGDGQYLMTISQDRVVRLFSVVSRKPFSEHKFNNQAYEIWGATLSFDGRYLAVESGPSIQVLNTSTWDRVQNFSSTSTGLFRLTFSPSGRYLAAVGSSDLVHVLDLRSGKIVWELSHSYVADGVGLPRPPTSFSSDERYLAVVNRDNSISVFDLSSGTEISNVIDEDIYSVQFGLDPPRNFAIGLDQPTARHWGLGTVRALAFSSDARYLVAAYRFSTEGKRRKYMRILVDQEVLVSRYLLRPDDLIADACSRLKQNLTAQQWKQYLGDEPYRKTCPNLP